MIQKNIIGQEVTSLSGHMGIMGYQGMNDLLVGHVIFFHGCCCGRGHPAERSETTISHPPPFPLPPSRPLPSSYWSLDESCIVPRQVLRVPDGSLETTPTVPNPGPA